MSSRFAVHVLMFDCEQFILRMIENCAPFVEKIYVAYSELPWTYNPDAQKRYKNTTDKDILKKSVYFNKIELIEGVWEKDEDQRNTCLEKARADGFDYLIIHDADEFYTKEDYQKNLNEIRENPNYDVYTTPWISFWKNLEYVVESKEDSIIAGYPQFAVNCKSNIKFIRARILDSDKTYQLSGLCYHLSYVMSNEHLYRKINTWGHSHQFNSELWYRYKWLSWNESTKNLHPVSPNAWKRAIKYNGKLPEVLIGFESPKIINKKLTVLDIILNFYYDQILLKSKAIKPLISAIILKVCGEQLAKDIYRLFLRTIDLLRIIKSFFVRIYLSITWRAKAVKLSHSSKGLQLHLGCGDRHFEGMLNCDYRPTKATDIVMDCGNLSRFSNNSVSLIFSHAFFEHLYRSQQIPFLKDCYRVLREDAPLVFLGIPDFQIIAESYLKGIPGISGIGDTFDIFHVYRYTHGHPEIASGYWLEQLHKSLFDRKYVTDLLSQSGFKVWTIFNYCYPGENIPLNLCFIAWKNKSIIELKEVLFSFSEYFSNINELLNVENYSVN